MSRIINYNVEQECNSFLRTKVVVIATSSVTSTVLCIIILIPIP